MRGVAGSWDTLVAVHLARVFSAVPTTCLLVSAVDHVALVAGNCAHRARLHSRTAGHAVAVGHVVAAERCAFTGHLWDAFQTVQANYLAPLARQDAGGIRFAWRAQPIPIIA